MGELQRLVSSGEAVRVNGLSGCEAEADADRADLFQLFETLPEEILLEVGFKLGQEAARLVESFGNPRRQRKAGRVTTPQYSDASWHRSGCRW